MHEVASPEPFELAWAGAAGEGGPPPVRVRLDPQSARIHATPVLHREGTPRHEIALLYRSNAQSRVLESALFNAHIPYKVYGGLRFWWGSYPHLPADRRPVDLAELAAVLGAAVVLGGGLMAAGLARRAEGGTG